MLVLAGAVSAALTPVASAITASGRMWAGFLINTGWPQTMPIGGWYLSSGGRGLAASRRFGRHPSRHHLMSSRDWCCKW